MMGSLNGDVMVMRNGRSTSQISVYNYPEHLNPFYEDDQHKRLRFWKISKKDNEGRRNSFSIGNLKDMWASKSFRLKKKSSTLGINKTSESPPMLRRDYALNNGYNTFDTRLRASNTSSMNGDSFQRNVTYRSSLQTLPTNNNRIGLNRNDGYRSTIQVTRSNHRYQPQQKLPQTMGVSQNRRYVYGGSVTPQPLRNTRTDIGKGPYEYDCDNAMTRGSSQSSMASTNPFESDDDENEDINSRGMSSLINGSTTTLTSRTPRKKRRAPDPPTPIHARSNGAPPPIILIEPSQENSRDELRIKEDNDIANLTAEIENFVKTKSNDDAAVANSDEVQTTLETMTNNKNIVDDERDEVRREVNATAKTDTSKKEKLNAAAKSNGQVTTEITTTTNITEPVKKETYAIQITNEIETTIYEGREIKTNGAIPKKPTKNSVTSSSAEQQLLQSSISVNKELCIKETYEEELSQKPVPFKRQIKPESEVGHVECIHVHVESPRATPRTVHANGLSSFKTNETIEATEAITTKTPFVLISPPTQKTERRQPVREETVQIGGEKIANTMNSELNIEEERFKARADIYVRPTLSPKPVTIEPNGKIHGFAEIHKPTRRNTQNINGKRASRDESISPPIVPQHVTKEEEKKIINTVDSQSRDTYGQKPKAELINILRIVETATTIKSNGDGKSMEEREGHVKEFKENNCETSVTSNLARHNVVQKPDEEIDILLRPQSVNHMEWKRSTLAPLETNIPLEKRKSVKDIIESINRSQRLLNAAANKDFTVLHNQITTTNTAATRTMTKHPSSIAPNNKNSLNENLKILDESQKEFQRFVEEMTPSTDAENLPRATNSPSPSPSNCNNEYPEEIFQKCKVKKEVYDYRESSPISSNLDWNPVPKPKRTKPAHE